MTRALLVGTLVLTAVTAVGQPQLPVTLSGPCTLVHKDAAVNTAITLTIPAPSVGRTIYLCGWDFQVTANGTGTAQINVLWTTTNLNGLAVGYSIAGTASAMVSGAFYPGFLIQAQVPGQAVTIISPAVAAANAYSANAYYLYGPPLPVVP
jgi:hypothetical protein